MRRAGRRPPRLSALVLCLLALCLLPVVANAASPPTVVINDLAWPPYYLGGEPDRPKGFAKEILEICVPQAGFAPRFIPYPIPRMYPMLRNGSLDVHVMSHRTDRESFLFYGEEPLFQSSYRPIVRADSEIEIRSLEDFDSLRLGHVKGLKYSDWFLEYVEKREREGHLETTPREETAVAMLIAGRLDVYVGSPDGARWIAMEKGVPDRIRALDFDIRTSPYYVVVSKQTRNVDDPKAFLKTVDRCLRDLKADGRYRAVAERYGVEVPDTARPAD